MSDELISIIFVSIWMFAILFPFLIFGDIGRKRAGKKLGIKIRSGLNFPGARISPFVWWPEKPTNKNLKAVSRAMMKFGLVFFPLYVIWFFLLLFAIRLFFRA